MKELLKVVLGFNPLALVHLLRLQPRGFVEACRRGFIASFRTLNDGHIKLPEIELGEILGDRQPFVRLTAMRTENGMLPSEQLLALLAILIAEEPREVLEIGTFMGHTTRQMAENLQTAIIHTVDLPPDFSAAADPVQEIPKDDLHLIARRTVGREFQGQPCAARIRQHFGDSASWDFRQAGKPTFFFIDGAHTYEYCKSDSERCFELCGGRGVFLWHDCDPGHPGVLKFVEEWRHLGRDLRRITGTNIAYWKSL